MAEPLVVRTLTLAQVREIYNQRITRDFPPDELKPLKRIEQALAGGRYACYGYFDGERILAYAYFAKPGRHALVDFFAVTPSMREKGLGSRFLRALIDGPLREMDCVLLEIDDPDRAPDPRERELRQRRLRFYQKNGIVDTGVRATVFHVAFRILALPVGRVPAEAEARRVYASIYRAMLPESMYEKMIRIEEAFANASRSS